LGAVVFGSRSDFRSAMGRKGNTTGKFRVRCHGWGIKQRTAYGEGKIKQ